MTKKDMEPIARTYYEALEEGRILGRKCKDCGHIEFPPYICCNVCGCLDTEWVEITGMRGRVTQVLPTMGAFGDPDFRKMNGDYWAIAVEVPDVDPFSSSLLRIDADRLEDFTERIYREDVYVKPLIIQDEDVKVVVWELEDEEDPFRKIPDLSNAPAWSHSVSVMDTSQQPGDGALGTGRTAGADIDVATDPIAQIVVNSAADAYGVDVSELTMATDIREDLSNESMKMIVMISEIEDETGVTIEIQEASLLNTLADFVYKVKENM